MLVLELASLGLLTLFFALRSDRLDRKKLLFGIYCLLLALNSIFAPGRSILSPSLIDAGSGLTRHLLFAFNPADRRAVEPFFWLFILLLTRVARVNGFSWLYICAALLSSVSLVLEVTFLRKDFFVDPAPWVKAHFVSVQLMFLFLFFALFLDGLGKSQKSAESWRCNRICYVAAVLLPLLSSYFIATSAKQLIVAAHYYSWFPDNWQSGYVGEKLLPAVRPVLGHYRSAEPDVFASHLKWAKKAGINVFVFDWWPKRSQVRKNIEAVIPQLEQSGLKFAVMYETTDLISPGEKREVEERGNEIYFSEARKQRLVEHFRIMVEHFVPSSAYLRFYGKPVVFVYSSRHLLGPVRRAFERARQIIREESGYEFFIIGDEAFYNVLDYEESKGIHLLPEFEPAWDRLLAFDAITVYNPYETNRRNHAGEKGVAAFFADTSELYQRYFSVASAAGFYFVPAVLAGYNDRGVRLAANHYVLPRYVDSQGRKTFFQQSLESLIQPLLDKDSSFFTITSWNEWNEGSQIEPATESARTREDISGESLYSANELHDGYAERYLNELSSFINKAK